MSVIKVNMTCIKCGKNYTRSKSRMHEHSLCRSCHMIETYANKPEILEKAIIKRRKTCLEIYGVDNPAKNSVCQDKEKKTRLERYGYEKPFQNKKMQEAAENAAHSKKSEEKRITTCLERYGENHHMKNKEVLKRIMLNTIEKNGLIGNYKYNNIFFDSSWELAYYIWLVDNKKQFIYHPKFSFEYIGDDSKTHLYFPDFLVEGTFIEIKGQQFFNEKGEPFNMYTKSFWYGKYNMLLQHSVVILKFEEIVVYLKYVTEKYGKKYLKQFKIKNKGSL